MLVDIDVAKLGSFPAAEGSLEVKTGEISFLNESGEAEFARIAVTLPEDLLRLVDEYAGKHQLSRSAVLTRAAMMFLTGSGG